MDRNEFMRQVDAYVAEVERRLGELGAAEHYGDILAIRDSVVIEDRETADCDACPCPWCGICISCGDFHFYSGRGCSTDVCPLM